MVTAGASSSRTAVTVSVALCTYNGAAYLAEQLQSILEQTRPVTEVVVSDDGSVDATLDIVSEFATTASRLSIPVRFTILRNARPLGVTANFEQAMRGCGGELILLSDQDDIWYPERVERMIDALEQRRLDVLFCDADLIDAEGKSLGITLFEALEVAERERSAVQSGLPFPAFLRRNIATGATMLVRRSVLVRALPFPQSWVHDEWLATVAAATARIGMLDTVLMGYRQHGGNQIGVTKPTLRYKVRRTLEPRGDRIDGLVARTEALVERLEHLDPAPEVLELAREKVAVEAARAQLPASRWRRIRPVLAAGLRGEYDLTSRGRLDMLRDVLQSHRAADTR